MKRFLFVSLALVGVMAGAPFAHATVLAPGGSSPTVDTSTLAGLTLVDQWAASPAALSAPGGGVTQTIFGTYQEWVYKDASGNLTFLEQVNLAAGSEHVARITASSYASFMTDVHTLTGALPPTGVAGGSTPNNAALGNVIDRDATGAVVGFNFISTPIPAGGSSAVLVITTDAKNYDRHGVLSVIDGTTSSNQTFEPTSGILSVPEPSSLVLGGIGALGMIGFGLRRRKALGA